MSVAFSLDDKKLALTSTDGTVRLWDEENENAIGTPLEGHSKDVNSVVISPHGKKLASASKMMRLWDVETTKSIGGPLEGHTGTFWSAVFSPEGKTLASASADKTVRL